jgi:L-threonylcarbamoyladenylate synthase
MTEIISPECRQQIKLAVGILKRGGVVAFPTETVYGLGASIKEPRAASRIYDIKGRSLTKALPLVLSKIEQLDEVAMKVPPVAYALAERFWPGALTIIVFKSSLVPDEITCGGKTVAVRVSSHPVAVELVEHLGSPVTGTSANISGKPSPVDHIEVKEQLGCSVDFIIEAGRCPGGIESTIIDITKDIPIILRQGAISRQDIEKVCRLAP